MAKKAAPTPLSTDLKKKLAAMGVTGITTEEDARTFLLEKLTAAGYEGFEEDTTDNIIDIASAIVEPEEAAEEEAEEETEEEEATEEAEEEEEETAPPAKKNATTTKKAIPKAKDEDMDELAEEVEKTGAKATIAKKKPAADAAKAAPAKRATNGFDKNNAEHMALATKIFGKIFDLKKTFALGSISGGVSLRLLGDNVKIVVLKYSNVTVDNGRMLGNLNFKKIKEAEKLQALLPETDEFEALEIERVDTRGYVRINKISDKQIATLFSDPDVLATVLKGGKDIDKKMGNNRAKLETTLNTSTKKGAAAPETEEEEEEEVAAPVAKKKVIPAPPATKKVIPAAAPAKKAAAPAAPVATKKVAPKK